MQNAKPTLRSESRGQTCLYYAEPRGGKALEEGLMQNAKFKMQNAELSFFTFFALFLRLLHRLHILCFAEVETYAHIDIRRSHHLWHRIP